jgi:predicted helicase
LQSGIIKDEDLKRKYTKEIHANEIILLAYYIASINIENVYHDQLEIAEPYNPAFFPIEERFAADGGQFSFTKNEEKKGEKIQYAPPPRVIYTPFPGICLTDTFQLGETKEGENLFSEIFPQNSERVLRQQKTPLRVIIGNPPYSVGQKSANDNAQNQVYPKLEARIATTYAANSTSTSIKSLYDSYIKAFRWATDRIDINNGGIIGFITNSGWIDKGGADGMRKFIEKEFSSIYILNLRGAIKGKSGEAVKREGQNVFDITTGVAITFLIKNPNNNCNKANIFYASIDDYTNRKEKLSILSNAKTIYNEKIEFNQVLPNESGDWINLRSDQYSSFISIEPEKKFTITSHSFFTLYSLGLNSNRDAWVYNSSKDKLSKNIKNHISFYNKQVDDYSIALQKNDTLTTSVFKDNSPDKISWSSSLEDNLRRLNKAKYDKSKIMIASYRPFTKQYVNIGEKMIHRPGQFHCLFPMHDIDNYLICVNGVGFRKDEFSCVITNNITDLEYVEKTQCFPLYWYEKKEKIQKGLFEKVEEDYIRRDAISDFILEQAKSRYGNNVTKKDIFYYVYGILHSPDYRKTFANDLKKMLPRLPLVEKPTDFRAFYEAGKALAELHLNYEEQRPPKEVLINGKPIPKEPFPENQLSVTKMTFPAKEQKDTIIYNSFITISNIPDKAYNYIVNGKSAIEWVMERYAVTTHKESGIKNNPNDWAIEHEKPQYILDLLLSVIAVSMKTVDIVAGLPKVDWE